MESCDLAEPFQNPYSDSLLLDSIDALREALQSLTPYKTLEGSLLGTHKQILNPQPEKGL